MAMANIHHVRFVSLTKLFYQRAVLLALLLFAAILLLAQIIKKSIYDNYAFVNDLQKELGYTNGSCDN